MQTYAHTTLQHNTTHTHTRTHARTYSRISGQWNSIKGFKEEKGFHGRFERTDRGRTMDKQGAGSR